MKKCSICKKLKELSEYNKNKNKKDGLNTICKECSRKKSKKYYDNHKKLHLHNIEKRKKENWVWFQELKKSWKCFICDEKETVCLDLHHNEPNIKEGIMSDIICSRKFGKKRILEEINKCTVVCSNCHRKIHAGIIIVPLA